jgi:hypothetical protein
LVARHAVVRSISLAPEEAALADRLAGYLTGGSFTDLTRIFLHWFGEPLGQRLQELVEAGINPLERVRLTSDGAVDVERETGEFYRPDHSWPREGPTSPAGTR